MKNSKNTKKLVVSHLSKTINHRKILDNISLSVHQSEIVGILGPNGAGKTTCFKSIIGLIKPDNGTITLNNHNMINLPIYRRARAGLGYLPQESSIFRGMNVEENLLAIIEFIIDDKDEINNQLEYLLAEFSIGHLRKVQASQLSGGERRRLEIARCLASKPDFIMLDEPFAGVDPVSIDEIKNLIKELRNRYGIGFIITDHNVREVLDLIDRTYIIYSGRVLVSGTTEEIISNDQVRKLYLGDSIVK